MAERKLRQKTIYLLLWLLLVCGGILYRTGQRDDWWQAVYNGIYKTDTFGGFTKGRQYTGEIYTYMSFWESQVRAVCDLKTETTGPADNEDTPDTADMKAADENKNSETISAKADGAAAVSAMADITSSYMEMDSDTLRSYCYNVNYPNLVKKDELSPTLLLTKDMKLDMDSGGYKVLIYHTHASESYADSKPGSQEDTVVGMGDYLAELLSEKYGIPVYHDKTQYDTITGTLDRNASYDYSREGVLEILEANPSIEVIIDLHRDGVPEDTRLVTDVDGKSVAQIMLINGMCRDEEGNDVDYWSNDNKLDNMAFALQTYLAGRGNYGDIMRKIYISTSRYNMDLMPRAMLAEIGAQTNTVEEAKRAIKPFAAMLAKVLLK